MAELQSNEKKRTNKLAQSNPDLVLPEGITASHGRREREKDRDKKLESHGKRKSARFRSLSGVVSDKFDVVVSGMTDKAGGLISGESTPSNSNVNSPEKEGGGMRESREGRRERVKLRTRTPSSNSVNEKDKEGRRSRQSGDFADRSARSRHSGDFASESGISVDGSTPVSTSQDIDEPPNLSTTAASTTVMISPSQSLPIPSQPTGGSSSGQPNNTLSVSPVGVGNTASSAGSQGVGQTGLPVIDYSLPNLFTTHCAAADLENMKRMIEANGPSIIEKVNEKEQTSLISAAGAGHLEIVKFLIEKVPTLSFINYVSPSSGTSALFSAAASGHLKVATTLLFYGASDHPLHWNSKTTNKTELTQMYQFFRPFSLPQTPVTPEIERYCLDIRNELLEGRFKGKRRHITKLQSRIRGIIARKPLEPIFKRKARRLNIATEVLSTEDTFINSLKYAFVSENGFMSVIRKQPGVTADSLHHLNRLSETAAIIVNIGGLFLQKVKARMERWFRDGSCIGDLFMPYVSFFRSPYSDFICRYEKAVKELNGLYAQHLDLKDKILAAALHAPKNSYFESVLIMPIQRPPRYVMLLQDMKKNTDEAHKDYPSICTSLVEVEEFANIVNEKKNMFEKFYGISLLSKRMLGYTSLMDKNGRYFLMMGRVNYFEEKKSTPTYKKQGEGQEGESAYLFLFSDLILLARSHFDVKTIEEVKAEKAYFTDVQTMYLLPSTFTLISDTKFSLFENSDQTMHVFCTDRASDWCFEIFRALTKLASLITSRIDTSAAVFNSKLPAPKDTVVNLISHKNFAQPSARPFKPDKYTCRFFEFDLLLFQVIPKDDSADEEDEEEIPDFTINLLKYNTNILKCNDNSFIVSLSNFGREFLFEFYKEKVRLDWMSSILSRIQQCSEIPKNLLPVEWQEITIHIKEGRNLLEEGASYIQVKCEQFTMKSSLSSTTSPKWNERFQFDRETTGIKNKSTIIYFNCETPSGISLGCFTIEPFRVGVFDAWFELKHTRRDIGAKISGEIHIELTIV